MRLRSLGALFVRSSGMCSLRDKVQRDSIYRGTRGTSCAKKAGCRNQPCFSSLEAISRHFRRTGLMEYPASEAVSLRLDAGELDHLSPFLGLVGDELAEIGRGAGQGHCPQGRK